MPSDRHPGDAELAGAVEAMREEQVGWCIGDLMLLTYANAGIVSPVTAKVLRVLDDGFLFVEIQQSGPVFAGFIINPSDTRRFVVERLA